MAIHSNFTAPLVYGDTAAIKKNDGSSLVFIYSIRRKRDGILCFEVDVTTVFMYLETMKSLPITDEFCNLFERYMDS